MQTSGVSSRETSTGSSVPESRSHEIHERPVEGRPGLREQMEYIIVRDQETGEETHYPRKRIWRNEERCIVAFVEWKYKEDASGIRPTGIDIHSETDPENSWDMRVEKSVWNSNTEQEFTYEGDSEDPSRERLIKRKNGFVVSVHDIQYGKDGSKTVTTWTPKKQGDKHVWNRFAATVLPDKTETQDETVSLSGPFKERKGILWPDARGERIGFVEPEETQIAWQS